MSIHIIGAGAWGSALARCLSDPSTHQEPITLWCRSAQQQAQMLATRRNARYLADLTLPETLHIGDLAQCAATAIDAHDVAIVSVPTAGLSALCQQHHDWLGRFSYLLLACKGIAASGKALVPIFPKALMESALAPNANTEVGLISGPSFAIELAKRLPSALTVAFDRLASAQFIAQKISRRHFRLYPCDDPQGVASVSALKNVLAIAVGLSDGLAMGDNARAALITRGLHEIAQLLAYWGGKPETLYGLAGVGDILLTCMGDQSRNRRAGLALAQGESVSSIRARLGTVEGLSTVVHIHEGLAQQQAIGGKIPNVPILSAINAVIAQQLSGIEAMQALLNRPLREHEHQSI